MTFLAMDTGGFGPALTRVMQELDVNATALGKRMGYPDGRDVRRWKNGHVTPGHDTIIRIADALGVPPARLFEGAADEEAARRVRAAAARTSEVRPRPPGPRR